MKFNILGLGLLLGASLAFVSCEDETEYSAPLTRFEVEDLSAVAGDESVVLNWQPQAGKPAPKSYLVSWQSSSAEDGARSEEVDGGSTSYTIENLTNDVTYTFSVQARYADGLAQQIKVSATPKTTRIPVTEFKATAGDKCVFLSWTEPVTDLNYSYEIVVSDPDKEVKTLQAQQGSKSHLVSDLNNDVEYKFDITAVYGHGRSVTLSSSAIPGHITAISCLPETPMCLKYANSSTTPHSSSGYHRIGAVEHQRRNNLQRRDTCDHLQQGR